MIFGVSLLNYGGDCPPPPLRLVTAVLRAAGARGHQMRVYGPIDFRRELPTAANAAFREIADPSHPAELFDWVCADPPDAVFFPQFWITPPQLSCPAVVLLPSDAGGVPTGPYRTSGFADIMRRADRILARGAREALRWRDRAGAGITPLTSWPTRETGDWSIAAGSVLDTLEAAAQPGLECVDPLPLVSVITPSFQQGRFLARTIESVLEQDYPHIELLVLDGGSTDETRGLLEQYGDRIRWVSRRDRGQSDAINRGLSGARGEVLAYLNSDDTYTPGAVRRAVAFLVGRPRCDLVYGRAWNIDEDDRVLEAFPSERFDPDRLLEQCIICQPTAFWRRRLHEAIGYFDEDVHFVMDYEFWLRAARVARIGMLEAFQANNRVWAGAKSTDARPRQILQALQMVHRHHGRIPDRWLHSYLDMGVAYPQPNWLPAPARPPLRGLMRLWHTVRLLVRLEGPGSALRRAFSAVPPIKYSDHWIGGRYVCRLPRRKSHRAIRLSGDSPVWPREGSPVLAIRVEGKPAGRIRLTGRGAFRAEVPLPALDESTAVVTIEVRAADSFIPAAAALGDDYRALSVRVHSLELVD